MSLYASVGCDVADGVLKVLYYRIFAFLLDAEKKNCMHFFYESVAFLQLLFLLHEHCDGASLHCGPKGSRTC